MIASRLGDDDQLRRVAHRAGDIRPDRLQRDEGLAELLREDGLDPVEVAYDHRLVEVVLDDEQVEQMRAEPRIRPRRDKWVRGVRDEDEAEEDEKISTGML